MSLFLKNSNIEVWGDVGTNKDQNYLTHSLFRYFGKLPPVLTAKILREFVPATISTPVVVDMMCGSGTTLVESIVHGFRSVGLDSNGLSIMVSKVKTTKIANSKLDKVYSDLLLRSKGWNKISPSDDYIPVMRNIDKWFTAETKDLLSISREALDTYKDDIDIYNFLFVSWLGIIRKCSNASVRTGRIFHDLQKPQQRVIDILFANIAANAKLIESLPSYDSTLIPKLMLGDARSFKVSDSRISDFTIMHPPYFALYKYSSDVLRFELEWGGYNRKDILKREVRDGFKTSKKEDVFGYIDDIVDCIANGARLTKKRSKICVVIGNSTLAEEQLPVVESVVLKAKELDINCSRIITRPINHAQAKYHKSANSNIKSDLDYILIFDS
ncbi:hypothetical protein [Geobacter sp. AOG1]|uniref:hypothetical protein n=1 Tax=Geobacter sp. AOG1 TaxID=1566346 RepID=UPI001CC7DAEE|nr:hypothetical protein [Geobacter sp. AOG1]GFE57407.1 hypothetical protein AOG1_12870 [Geobacter sp. AOG1]